jgi:hypothetical protein
MSFRQRLRTANACAKASWQESRRKQRSEPKEVEVVEDYTAFMPIIDQDGVIWRRTLNYREPPPWK